MFVQVKELNSYVALKKKYVTLTLILFFFDVLVYVDSYIFVGVVACYHVSDDDDDCTDTHPI